MAGDCPRSGRHCPCVILLFIFPRILHFYALIEFAQYLVFSRVFALSAFVLAAVFLRSNLPSYFAFLRGVFSSGWGFFLPVIHCASETMMLKKD
jgi:hypothetical protein